jgi:hypothetical protein
MEIFFAASAMPAIKLEKLKGGVKQRALANLASRRRILN